MAQMLKNQRRFEVYDCIFGHPMQVLLYAFQYRSCTAAGQVHRLKSNISSKEFVGFFPSMHHGEGLVGYTKFRTSLSFSFFSPIEKL